MLNSQIPIEDRRGIIQVVAQLCLSGCDNVENMDHLILGYDLFGRISSLVVHWLGIYSLNPVCLSII